MPAAPHSRTGQADEASTRDAARTRIRTTRNAAGRDRRSGAGASVECINKLSRVSPSRTLIGCARTVRRRQFRDGRFGEGRPEEGLQYLRESRLGSANGEMASAFRRRRRPSRARRSSCGRPRPKGRGRRADRVGKQIFPHAADAMVYNRILAELERRGGKLDVGDRPHRGMRGATPKSGIPQPTTVPRGRWRRGGTRCLAQARVTLNGRSPVAAAGVTAGSARRRARGDSNTTRRSGDDHPGDRARGTVIITRRIPSFRPMLPHGAVPFWQYASQRTPQP